MSRRLEKITRTIRDTVSGVIQNQLADPRLRGLISVTRVQVVADLSMARVYLSVLGATPDQQQLDLQAIQHAAGFIQSRLASVLTTRTCPILKFILDDSLKKGADILRLIDEVSTRNDQHPLEPTGDPSIELPGDQV